MVTTQVCKGQKETHGNSRFFLFKLKLSLIMLCTVPSGCSWILAPQRNKQVYGGEQY